MKHQIDTWMAELTLEEKASLCSGMDLWHTKAIERLGIPSLTITDGPHGVRLAETGIMSQMRIMAMSGKDTIEQSTYKATCFPTASALAATWNLDLIEHIGEAMGREAKSLGIDMILAPGINIIRTPLGGRNFEFYSEDQILSSAFGIAMINGIQSQGVGAVLKHFVCNNSEFRRMTVDVQVDDRTLHELYLKSFHRVIKHTMPAAIMSAYNKVNGAYCSQSKYLLTDVLRDKWDYDGLVISDWAAVYDRVIAIRSGLDLEMPGFVMHDEEIVKAVKNGTLEASILDDTVRRILKCIINHKLKAIPNTQTSEHHGLASHTASESFILLKNENGLLPIDSKQPVKVALIGEGWTEPIIQGEGGSKVRPNTVDEPLKSLKKVLHKNSEIMYFKRSEDLILNEIKSCDIAIVMVSQVDQKEQLKGNLNLDGEGGDKQNLSLPESSNMLIKTVVDVCDNTAVCIMNGGPVDVSPWYENVKGVFMLWLSGEGLGSALADILTGVVNPSGKLPVSWPIDIKHSSSHLHFPGEDDKLFYGERIFVGYKYAQSTGMPSLFPFGYGLSYSSFEIVDARLEEELVCPHDVFTIKVQVKNNSEVPGKTVVQVYSRRESHRVKYPFRQLVGFAKVAIQPGESKWVDITLEADDLTYYNTLKRDYELEPGRVYLDVGESSEEITLTLMIESKNPNKDKPYLSKYSYLSEWLADEEGKAVIQEVIRAFVPFEEIPLDHPIVMMFLEMPLVKIVNFSGGLINEDFLDHLELTLLQKRENL